MSKVASAPQRMSRYELKNCVHQNALSERWSAVDLESTASPRDVVIDKLAARWATDEEVQIEYARECATVVGLFHPNLPTHESLVADGEHWGIVSRNRPGHSLRSLWHATTTGELSLQLRLHVLAEVLSALQFAHNGSNGQEPIAHGNLDPSSIWLADDGQVVVHGVGHSGSLQRVNARVGRVVQDLRYAAPEILKGQAADHRTDIYSVGVLLWEAMTISLAPGEAESSKLTSQPPPRDESRLRAALPNAPGRLLFHCARALSTEPNQRYQSLDDFGADLLGFLEDVYCQDRRERPQQIVRVLRRFSPSSLPRAVIPTRRLPPPLPASMRPGASVTAETGRALLDGPSAERSNRSPTLVHRVAATLGSTKDTSPAGDEPDTRSHAVFSSRSTTQRGHRPPAPWAVACLVLSVIAMFAGIRRLTTMNVSASAQDPMAKSQIVPPPAPSSARQDWKQEASPSQAVAALTPAAFNPDAGAPVEQLPLQTGADVTAMPTLRLEQLREVGAEPADNSSQPSDEYSELGELLEDGLDATPADDLWAEDEPDSLPTTHRRGLRARTILRPIDTSDPYAD